MAIIDQLERGNGKPGTGEAIATAAKRIGCEEAVLEAILEVESGGDPFDAKGRLIILPEKHIFWRYLPKALRGKAQAKGLATPKWSRANYKGLGGKGSDVRWQRLRAMTEMDETAGLQSASYGGPQIMGFNHKLCGYGSVQDFVLALAATEDNQDAAFIAFLEGVGLAADLREKDFRAIARRYNGSGQVERYAGMMQTAYRRILADSDRKPSKVASVRAQARARSLRIGSDGYRVKALQEKLVALGYHVVPDGDFGPATRRAVVAFQSDHGLTPDGIVGPKTEGALDAAVPINDQPGGTREALTVADLRKRGSQTVKQADRLTAGGVLALVFGSAGELDQLPETGWLGFASGLIGQARAQLDQILSFVGDHKTVAIILAGLAVLYVARRIKARRLDDAKNWRHVG